MQIDEQKKFDCQHKKIKAQEDIKHVSNMLHRHGLGFKQYRYMPNVPK